MGDWFILAVPSPGTTYILLYMLCRVLDSSTVCGVYTVFLRLDCSPLTRDLKYRYLGQLNAVRFCLVDRPHYPLCELENLFLRGNLVVIDIPSTPSTSGTSRS